MDKNDQSDALRDFCVIKGKKAILKLEPYLHELAERCDQPVAMHWLSYFLGGAGARWKQPYLVLSLNPGASIKSLQVSDLRGAALFFEIGGLGLRTGAFSTDDWEGLRTVIAPPGLRSELAARAVQVLIQHGAHIMLTTYRCFSSTEQAAGTILDQSGILWTEYSRELTKHRLVLEDTYEKMLAKFGKQTRFNLRYYRKRLMARMECTFLSDARAAVTETELLHLNRASLNRVPDEECRRRYRATRDPMGGFLIGLRKNDGQLMSVLGGWRHGTTTVMHHQMNLAGFERDSLGTVMRAFFLESEIARGTQNIIFYHGTNHTMSHAFHTELLRDLVVRRKTLRARLLFKLAGRLASPRYYSDAHYFGGSATFFAAALTNNEAVWRS